MENILFVVPTWLGDCIMAMPAVQALKRETPGACFAVLAKPAAAGLWRLNSAVDFVLEMPVDVPGIIGSALEIRAKKFSSAYILPLSFRSALIPFLAGIPVRIGMPGHFRDAMLTDVRRLSDGLHQVMEYMELLGLAGQVPERVSMTISRGALEDMGSALAGVTGSGLAGIMPGSAFGPSKRWPVEHFVKVAAALMESGRKIVLMGSPAEADACFEMEKSLGRGVVNLAGRTNLEQLAAALSLCDLVIANDSGGAHLAAAVGTPVIVIFGVTDPGKTAPYGEHVVVMQNSAEKGRDMAKKKDLASARLRAVGADEVARKALELFAACSKNQKG